MNQNVIGQRYERLVVIEEAEPAPPDGAGKRRRRMRCQCDCGKVVVARLDHLRRGATVSCGCAHRNPRHPRKQRQVLDLTGRRYGKLVVLSADVWQKSPAGKRYRLAHCRCDCGGEITVRITSLTMSTHGQHGGTRSCGCLQRENGHLQGSTSGDRLRVHGESHPTTREYRTYTQMLNRCYNKHNKQFPRYGGRGIVVCPRWRESYTTFLTDMGRRPPGCTIDRKNNDGPYEPENCRWVTPTVQNQNRGLYNLKFELDGVTQTLSAWVREYKVPYARAWRRLQKGWSLYRALTAPKER